MNGYLEDIVNNAIDAVQEQVNRWRADGEDIIRNDIDNLIDQYHDEITGNDVGAVPGRIYTADARDFYKANADATALCEWCKEWDGLETFAKACAEDNYNTLDVLEAIRIYDNNRDAIVDAVCEHYNIAL